MSKGMKRILIINVNWIGDVLFSTPFIRAVRAAYPDSYIACLLHPRCSEILEGNPRLDEIIIYDEEGIHKSILGKLALIDLLRKRQLDTAFILHRSFTKALIAYLAGTKDRIGYPTKNRSIFLTKSADTPEGEVHKVEYFLNIAGAAGIEPQGNSYEFFISDRDRSNINSFLREKGVADSDKVVVICPGGNWDPKRWPKENFARVSDLIIEGFGAKVVIAGANKDIKLADEIKGMINKGSAISSCGNTTLKELGALFERAALVIANDTGPMHIAVAMKTDVISLFGPTSPKITGPYGEGSYRVISRYEECDIPCYDMSCTDNRCMAAIKVEDVWQAAEDMLKA